jgi:large subunit ribosomal protein L15
MDLHAMNNTGGARRSRKRVGRGMGSGLGKTCGRGHKGQMSRKGHKHKAGFEGGQMRLVRRIPKRGFKNPVRRDYTPVNVGDLAAFPDGTAVTSEALRACGLAQGPAGVRVKLLGRGNLACKLTVKVEAASASARAKIEAAGGTCETAEA